MRIPRFYCPGDYEIGQSLALSEAASKHLHQVLRMKPGQPIVVFDGEGLQADATLIESHAKHSRCELTTLVSPAVESPLALTLVQGLCQRERMDLVVQKAVELGVQRIVPYMAARSTTQLKGERAKKRFAHWQAVMLNACEQSGRTVLPTIEPLCSLKALPELLGDGQKLLFDVDGEHTLATIKPPTAVTLFVGPEGGWDDQEKLRLLHLPNIVSVTLGPRVLRTETGAIASIAACQTLWGDWLG